MEQLLEDAECIAIVRKLAKELTVRASLITTRLLSENDKQDLRMGELSTDTLRAHIEVWVANGMPDYAHGLDDMRPFNPYLSWDATLKKHTLS